MLLISIQASLLLMNIPYVLKNMVFGPLITRLDLISNW